MTLEEFGTDISWELSNNDVAVVSDEKNLMQSISNRLNTAFDELDYIYENYGCNFQDFLGAKKNDTTLEFIKNSIVESLQNEPRVVLLNLDLSYSDDDKLNIILDLEYNENETIEASLIIGNEGVLEIEDAGEESEDAWWILQY